jgi:Family of unknown function (DUF5958)
MKLHENKWILELPDLIRVNQFVRHHINFYDFNLWYQELTLSQQQTLTNALCEFAYQAGVNDDICDEAFNLSDLSSTQVAEQFLSFHRKKHPDLWGIYQWIMRESEKELHSIFKLFVFLFGVAESKVYRAETKANCNHWWHRDLLNDRVAQDLLNNPRFYCTAMRDDDKFD